MSTDAFRDLGRSLDGDTILPDDGGYDEARTLFNAMIDKRPAVIARCKTVADVQKAVVFARDAGIELAVRAGGHSVAGMSLVDGGLVIDVRELKDISVDPEAQTVRAGAGLTWGEFDAATQEHGLATTGGRVSTTGVAGLTLGGGSGWLERSYGLACDNLVAVELVTAAGDLVRASEAENPELFWALHGGGGNFGVATSFEFRLHAVGPMLFAGLAAYDPQLAQTLGRVFRDFHESGGPEEAGLALVYLTAPPEDFIPAEWQGKLVVALAGCWNGPAEDGEQALRPLITAAEPIVDLFGEMPYTAFQSMIDDPPGFRNWWTAEYLDELPDEALDSFIGHSEQMPISNTQSLLLPWGGAVARAVDTPLANRDAQWIVHPFCVWEGVERDDEHISWGRAARGVLAPWRSGGVYLNFVGDEGQDRVRAAFGDAGYERLAAIKAQYDPDNLFRGNQNILPRSELAHA
jgi:FAD/FMN-containing dehydrogenase